MPERTSYPPGVPCWVDLMVPDPDAAMAFYGGLFGWKFDNRAPEGSPGPYAIAQLDGLAAAAIGGPLPDGASPAWNMYVAVDSVDDTAKKVREAGGQVILEPDDVPDAGRLAMFTDLEGAVFGAWEEHGFIGAQTVNGPGTWVLNDLNTRDPKGAADFYGAVFGWNVEHVALGDPGFEIFTLEGYGEILAKDNPEVRAALDQGGPFATYSNAVTFVVEMTPDRFPAEVPPHWSITFAVDDADATAATAEQLGGKVLLAPVDIEPVRTTILTDPAGAQFTASRYQPPDDW